MLLNKLSELGYTTDYKIHPKNKVKLFNGKNKIITKRLSHVNFEEYDAIIVDYVSTGLSQAIYSSRPVWFFDTGLRKMQPYFYEHFLRRGIKPINFKGDISAQIENIIKIYDSEDKLYNVRLR